MRYKEKNRLPLALGDGLPLASSGVLASGLSLASGLEVKENEDLLVFINDSSKAMEDLQDVLDKKFTPKRVNLGSLSDTYFDLGYIKRALLVADCGSFLEFHVFDYAWKLKAANFCKDRLCPMCNWRRSLKIFSQVSQVMNYLEPKGYQYLFLTLTLRNEPAERFPDMIQSLFDGWRELYHENKVFKKVVEGTLRFLEVTINHKTHTFHAHLHVVLAVYPDYFHKEYISQSQWTEMWASASNLDYTPIVHIERFKAKPGSSGLGSAVAEAVKYAMKDSDYLVDSDTWRPVYVETLLRGLSGRRLFGKTGCFGKAWRDLKLGDPEAGELTEDDQLREDIDYMIVRYGWRNGVYVRI
ncbi:protein rep [Glycocaulis alkaliphilus]|uniref:protein rep n=1 Tax=Glycocaulis alkaliphilus TaxID=1434191 RepID=UPI001668E922|nr:protein rep [Glycocaulis alkaliphilus]GGB87152.1 hypothetical protein GCM10007417_28980 [Glycocaulis alkaliphilus]